MIVYFFYDFDTFYFVMNDTILISKFLIMILLNYSCECVYIFIYFQKREYFNMPPLVFSGLYIHTHVIQTEAFDCYIVVYKECVILEWDVKQHLIHQPKCY